MYIISAVIYITVITFFSEEKSTLIQVESAFPQH